MPVSPRVCPVAIADALAIVNVGNRLWLLVKLTPRCRIDHKVGMSCALIEPKRRPSATKIIAFRREDRTDWPFVGESQMAIARHIGNAGQKRLRMVFILVEELNRKLSCVALVVTYRKFFHRRAQQGLKILNLTAFIRRCFGFGYLG